MAKLSTAIAKGPGTSRLYYESHVTLRNKAVSSITGNETLQKFVEDEGWRFSTFLLRKPEDPEPQAFLSCRDKSLKEMKNRVSKMCRHLDSHGYEVVRWKVEDTLFDSNHGDIL